MTDNTVLLLINSQWWFHDLEKDKKLIKGCDSKTRETFLVELKSEITKNFDKHIVIAMHHPMFTKGERGGKYSYKDHIFPLTNLNKNLYIPLPVVGSLYPIFKNLSGSTRDLSNLKYKTLKEARKLLPGKKR